ncbi:hypothetical protein H8356DRAFT_1640893, partial [Neocallimastix lanati (nom. inval.)]
MGDTQISECLLTYLFFPVGITPYRVLYRELNMLWILYMLMIFRCFLFICFFFFFFFF